MQKEYNNAAVLSEKQIYAQIVNEDLHNIRIFTYDMTDSTNTRAREYAKCGSVELPCVFIAGGQYAGRGRRGRAFDSERGAGLYISFLFKPEGDAPDLTSVTARAAVKVCRAIESVCDISLGIKWVNDVFVNEKKLAGILTEGEFDSERGGFAYLICGIGINLLNRAFPDEISDIATSVEKETGYLPDVNLLAARLICEFFSDDEPCAVMEEYRRRSTVIGKRVEVRRISGETFFAKADTITDSGALAVRRDDGAVEELVSAEVSIRHTEKY